MRVLIVEDDENLALTVKSGLEENGYAVDLTANGQDGVEMASIYSFDVIILDIMLPDIDGFMVCKTIRSIGIKTPILILTARYREDDRVRGLDFGADDYLVKPFSYPELYARIRALIRRSVNNPAPEINVGKLVVQLSLKKVFYQGEEISLTAKEYAIMEYLVINRGGVVTREMLEEHVWDSESGAFSNVIEVLISRIRKKLCPDNREAVIRTVKGLGYVVKDEKS
jgi:DNA-binding response OmpR family regulator